MPWRCGCGTINAHVIRIDALGKRLTQMANISSREFDFDREPPQGGSDSDGVGQGARVNDLTAMIDDLWQQDRRTIGAILGTRECNPGPRAVA